MGLLRLLKLKARASRLLDRLDQGAHDWDARARTHTTTHALYLNSQWQHQTLKAAADLVEVLPLPERWKGVVMGLIGNLLKNWKTTALGLATGAGVAFLSAIQGGMTLKDAALAAGVAALGMAAKDSTVSGR